jgi:hypothetical protein
MTSLTDDPQGLHGRFWQAFGRESTLAICSVVVRAHLQAAPRAKEVFGFVGEERCGLFRWMQVDSELLGLTEKYPGVRFKWERNPGCGGHHVDISAFNFRMLVVHDGDPESDALKSEYAKTLAESNQFRMFEDDLEFRDKSTSDKYLVILFHSKDHIKGCRPYALELKFPLGRGEYAASSIDLFNEFPELRNGALASPHALQSNGVAGSSPVKEEEIDDLAHPQPRDDHGMRQSS